MWPPLVSIKVRLSYWAWQHRSPIYRYSVLCFVPTALSPALWRRYGGGPLHCIGLADVWTWWVNRGPIVRIMTKEGLGLRAKFTLNQNVFP